MKKYLILTLLVIVFTSAFSIKVHATYYGEACPLNSYYDGGGTNCTCSDGYHAEGQQCVPTSTPWWSTSQPTNLYPVTSCPAPTVSDCDVNNPGNAVGSSGQSSGGPTTMVPCQNRHDLYQSQISAYNSCVSTQTTQNTGGVSHPAGYNPQQWYSNYKACGNIRGASLDDSTNPNGECACVSSGYVFNSDKTSCVMSQQTQDARCNDNLPNEAWNAGTGKCECKSGYTFTLDSSDKLACMTPQEIQNAPQSPSIKQGILNSEKTYPDAGITGNEKTSQELTDKINKSGSYLAYKKIQPLTADQIIANMNLLVSKPGGTPQDMQDYVDFLGQYQIIPKLVTIKYPAHSVSDYAKTIRTNLNIPKNIDDATVVKEFIAKYPAIKDRVNLEATTPATPTTPATVKSVITPKETVSPSSTSSSNISVNDSGLKLDANPQLNIGNTTTQTTPTTTKQNFFQRVTNFFARFKFW